MSKHLKVQMLFLMYRWNLNHGEVEGDPSVKNSYETLIHLEDVKFLRQVLKAANNTK